MENPSNTSLVEAQCVGALSKQPVRSGFRHGQYVETIQRSIHVVSGEFGLVFNISTFSFVPSPSLPKLVGASKDHCMGREK